MEITRRMEGECRPITWGDGLPSVCLGLQDRNGDGQRPIRNRAVCVVHGVCVVGLAVIYCLRIQGHGNPASDVLAFDCRPADRPEGKTEGEHAASKKAPLDSKSEQGKRRIARGERRFHELRVSRTDRLHSNVAGKCPRSLLTSGTTLTGVGCWVILPSSNCPCTPSGLLGPFLSNGALASHRDTKLWTTHLLPFY